MVSKNHYATLVVLPQLLDPCLYSCTSLFLCSEIQSLQDEVPELKNRLQKAEADLVKAIEGEKKVSEEVC